MSEPLAIVATARPVTLADLDAMPATPQHHAALGDMDVDQLAAMFHGLDRTRENCESMSGICATLAGLVLTEVKSRLGHGNFKPWLKQHFPKSARSAQVYMQLGNAFSKSAPRCAFDQMTLALMDSAQSLDGQSVDLTHPVVAEVAKWTAGRSFYQIREEVSPTKGGKTYDRENGKGDRHEPTAEEATALLQSLCQQGGETLAAIHSEKAFIALNDAELDGLTDHLVTVLEAVKAWRLLSKTERQEILAAQINAQLAA